MVRVQTEYVVVDRAYRVRIGLATQGYIHEIVVSHIERVVYVTPTWSLDLV